MKSRIFVYRVCLALYIALFAHAEKATALGESNWTVIGNDNASFTIGNTSATVTISNKVNTNSGSRFYTPVGYSGTNFPGSWYTTSPSTPSTQYVLLAVGNALASSTGSHRITITFNRPVTNPRIHFANLDNGQVDFGASTQTNGAAVSMTRLSGNNYFETSGTLVNTTQQPGNLNGCTANDGSNPNGGCGTLQFNGTYQTLVYTITDVNLATDTDDDYAFGVTIAEDYGDAPISGTAPSGTGTNNYGQASHYVTGSLKLGTNIDTASRCPRSLLVHPVIRFLLEILVPPILVSLTRDFMLG
jgi:hypothetical protein